MMSRNHAVLDVSRDGVILVDSRSTNGTKLNDVRVTRDKLRVGDRIGMGSIVLLFHNSLPLTRLQPHPEVVGVSSDTHSMLESVAKVGPHATSVLIQGETGTGKELVAHAVHRESRRRGDFVTVNCGAITDNLLQSELFGHNKGAFSGAHQARTGLFGAANNGTLFLDEIGEASPRLQVALLRVLETGTMRRLGENTARAVNVRVVAATNRDLEQMIVEGKFRADLYARLSGWVINVRPLRDRKEDIVHLARHFIRQAGSTAELSRTLTNSLLSYDWPFNVRELRTTINWALIENGDKPLLRMTPRIERLFCSNNVEDSPRHVAPAVHPGEVTLKSTLLQHNGNIKAVATELGVSRSTLYRWIKTSEIDVEQIRETSNIGPSTTVRAVYKSGA